MLVQQVRGRSRFTQERLTNAQHKVLGLIRDIQVLSYDEMAARLLIDRKTAIQAVRRLELTRRVVVVAGRGKQPNRYLLTDRVIVWNERAC